MNICGIKLTHDAAVALIKDNELIFCIEVEKINNNPRYSEILDTAVIEKILNDNGIAIKEIDCFAVDGWGGYDQDKLAIQPRLKIGQDNNYISVYNKNHQYFLPVAEYEEKQLTDDIITPKKFKSFLINGNKFDYLSFLHVVGHAMGAYASSPFAARNESSYILVWDGGMYPRLYYFDVTKNKFTNLGPLSFYVGNIYTIFSQHFEPFKIKGNFAKDDFSVAGKVMAYIASGTIREELYKIFEDIYYQKYDCPMGFANVFANEFKKLHKKNNYQDEDVLATFHKYLENHLLKKLKKKILRYDFENGNLCLAGGCALNIKWNSAIRKCGLFDEMYVPPFSNDSGSAIGVACCANHAVNSESFLSWSVYSGPELIQNNTSNNWREKVCSLNELAELIYRTNEPVIVLNGRSELGPRALGNRSILASARSAKMKDLLNKIKKREAYRPISPICLEDKAPMIFSPGQKDQFMLFDHKIKEEWQDKIPAVMHIDSTARLQTISRSSNKIIYDLLSKYYSISGIPLLCNTSANFYGKGFFPDIYSAMRWDQVNYIWSNDKLYIKNKKIDFNL